MVLLRDTIASKTKLLKTDWRLGFTGPLFWYLRYPVLLNALSFITILATSFNLPSIGFDLYPKFVSITSIKNGFLIM